MLSKEKQTKIQNIMLTVALLILLVTAVLPLFNVHWEYTKYIFAFGAVLALAERLTERYNGDNVRIKRLYRMGKISALFFCVAAFFLIYPGVSGQNWLPFLMAGAVLHLYATFAYEHESKRESKKD
ncbi:MAG: hypothetical protein II592_03400 [Muribaculaceae bacterium]|jgi:uncharacterized membrane protein|nr:hypothetical protein [Muribaculaceae bacterium]MBQ4138572.1 hypothetical protein [Muribaculaceae bacterium]